MKIFISVNPSAFSKKTAPVLFPMVVLYLTQVINAKLFSGIFEKYVTFVCLKFCAYAVTPVNTLTEVRRCCYGAGKTSETGYGTSKTETKSGGFFNDKWMMR